MCHIRLVVSVDGVVWDRVSIHSDRVLSLTAPKTHVNKAYGDSCHGNDFEIIDRSHVVSDGHGDALSLGRRVKFPITLNGHELSYFYHVLGVSTIYRLVAIKYWNSCLHKYIPFSKSVKLIIFLVNPPRQIIDYSWSTRITYMIAERSELDTAMSWLSTLGGAYSALGDHFIHCAHMAGRISLQQFKIALRLGDGNTVARCKLFLALSLIQTKRFRQAMNLIEEQYQVACKSPSPDIRLIRMCRGVWSKLRYERSRYIRRRAAQNN